jgi:flagellar motor switch/type III secretory pathway protein FliN
MAAAIAFPAQDHPQPAGAGWREVQDVTCSLAAEIPVRGFTIGDLLLLQAGSVVNSKQSARGKIGLHANGSFIAWAEFEVMKDRLGVRFTDLE